MSALGTTALRLVALARDSMWERAAVRHGISFIAAYSNNYFARKERLEARLKPQNNINIEK